MTGAPLDAHAVSVLGAVLALAAWTGVILVWLYATRLPAMRRAGLKPQSAAHVAELRGMLPSRAARVADNYNHLLEAPTVFYAVALAVVILGAADPLAAGCAWVFVALRVLHSLVQATINLVTARFLLFSLSWAALLVMLARAVLHLMSHA